ncbi:MAG: GNAT family N-acetyltransferase [Elusimicrobiota bacterium]
MIISGNNIKLKPAKLSDRKNIYLWLAKSDLTPSMMGLPIYPYNPVPTWREFCKDYNKSFFSGYGNKKGRNFIIFVQDFEIGTLGYDLMNIDKKIVLLDIWLRAEKYCGLGYGSDALITLCNYLNQKYGIKDFYISPSFRNKRAIAAYTKSGFKKIQMKQTDAKRKFGVDIFDYNDNIVMKKDLDPKNSD